MEDITHTIIGAAMAVHTELGPLLTEVFYQRALYQEFTDRGLRAEKEVSCPIYYKGRHIGTRRMDFVIEGKIGVEIKAVPLIQSSHWVQTLNYLEYLEIPTGLLVNFGGKSLTWKRLYNTKIQPNMWK